MKVIFYCFLLGCSSISPMEVEHQVGLGTVTVSWDANTEDDLSGYKIYYGTSSNSDGNTTTSFIIDNVLDVGDTTSFVIENLTDDVVYFFVVTAYDIVGNESDFSNEVSILLNDNRAPDKWEIVFLIRGATEIVLEIVPLDNETFDDNGWTIWGHESGNDSGIFILNPDGFSLKILLDAKIIGTGDCIGVVREFEVENNIFKVNDTFKRFEIISNSEKVFINFKDDCWDPDSKADANLRIENIKIFK